MQKFAIYCFAIASVAFVSGVIIHTGHNATVVTSSSIDPTALTLKAGKLPVIQTNEPF